MAYRRGKHRTIDVNAGLDSFSKAFDLTQKVMAAYQDADVKGSIKEGMAASRAEAAASGGTDYTLDRGADDAATPDMTFSSKGAKFVDAQGKATDAPEAYDARGAADDIAAQANDIASLQAEIDAEKAGGAGLQLRVPTPATGTAPQALTPAPAEPTPAPAQPGLGASAPAPTTAPAQPGLEAGAPAEPPKGPMTPAQFYARGEINKPQLSAMDIFHKKYAPGVAAKLMEQGRIDDATKFEDWTRSARGKAYGQSWMEGMQKVNDGDLHGGIMAAQDLYNRQLPNGRYAIAVPGKDGAYTIEVRDEKSNKLIGSRTGKAQEMAAMAYGMLSPEQVYKMSVEAPAAEAAQIRKEERETQNKIKVEQAKTTTESTPELAKLMKLRDSLPPGSRDRALVEQKIRLLTTREPAATTVIQMGSTPQPMAGGGQGVVVTDKRTGTGRLVPLAHAPNEVDDAYNALAGVTYAKPPGGVAKMYMRDGVPLSKTEREQAMKYHDALRRAKRLAPWEQPPGLKR